jgi:PTS system nitrogen regulatory IIA component
MKIMDFLNPKAISTDLQATDKNGIIRELIGLLVKAGEVKEENQEELVKVLIERESLGSTGIGQGIGIPHGKSSVAKRLIGAFGLSKKGVDFNALDGELVYIFLLLLSPENTAGPHLKALARVSRLFRDRYFRDSLRKAPDEKAVLKIIKQEDQKKE